MSRKYCAPRRIAYPLTLLDLIVDAVVRPRARQVPLKPTDDVQILLMSSGHLGDTLILTYLFPLIRERYPNARLDVLAGDWCDPVLTNNPYVRRVIHWNHVGTNRKKISRFRKLRQHMGMMNAAIPVLREVAYDYSIDIRFSDSPMHQILPFIRVNHSIGFGTRGLGGLLDEELFLPDGEFHHLDLLLALLAKIDVHATLPDIKPYFLLQPAADVSLLTKLPMLTQADRPLILVCPESGAASRFLPVEFWNELLTNTLTQTEALLLMCGQLPGTTAMATKLRADCPDQAHRVVDATNQLTIQELAVLTAKATLAYTVDSFPAHLCAIFCPLITYYHNGMGIQFFPIANFDTLLFHNHYNSRDLQLNRPDYLTVYTEFFGQKVVALSLQKAAQLVNRVVQ